MRATKITVLHVGINAVSYFDAAHRVLNWAAAAESRYICIANVHMLMEAFDSLEYNQIVNSADLVTSDGMPLVWMMRLKGQRRQERVYGPTLMLHVLEAAERENVPVGFYGSSSEVLHALNIQMVKKFPDLKIVYSFSPPYQDTIEDANIVDQINSSSARILFVGLGCPKQERWMGAQRGKINAVMLGVGAAFDFHAGYKPQSPAWMQKIGMEWFFRLISEPRRLWRRYLYHNSRFIILAIADLMGLLR